MIAGGKARIRVAKIPGKLNMLSLSRLRRERGMDGFPFIQT
jgi:hypothetical protein